MTHDTKPSSRFWKIVLVKCNNAVDVRERFVLNPNCLTSKDCCDVNGHTVVYEWLFPNVC